MKKISIMIVSLSVTVVFVFLLLAVFTKDYTLDLSQFENEIVHNGEISEETIIIEKKTLFGKKEIVVTPEMVTNVDVSTPGEKKLTITYEGETFEVIYYVKFKIDFKDGSELISSQTVFAASEIVVPKLSNKPGYIFVGWSMEIPSVLTSNLVIEAKYDALDAKLPNLGIYSATYEDTLASISLPSNEYGKWEFVDPLTTTVGNVGNNKFRVKFVSNYDLGEEKYDEVTVRVGKKTLEFKDLVLTFTYDGQIHIPTYKLGEGYEDLMSKVIYIGDRVSEVGKYTFFLQLDDSNYEALYQGMFEITSPVIVINVNSYIINFGDKLPEFDYTVTGLDDPSILDIKIIKPSSTNAGVYELDVTYDNTMLKDIIVNMGTLTINKINLYDFEETDIANRPQVDGFAYYSDTLSKVSFDYIPGGYWAWKEPNAMISTPLEFTATAVFIPNSTNYNEQEYTFTFDVTAKDITINILKNEFNFEEGKKFTLVYELVDQYGNVIDDEFVTVEGLIELTFASETGIINSLKVVDEQGRYSGSKEEKIYVYKANPVVDWTKVYTAVYGQKVEDVILDKYFSWDSNELNKTLTEIGTVTFNAIYNNQNPNYNVIDGELTINVEKLEVVFEGNTGNANYTYSGDAFDLEKLVTPIPSHVETEVKYYSVDGENETLVKEVIDAGSYKVVVTPIDTDHYAGSITINVTINPSRVNAPETFEAIYEDTLNTLILPECGETGSWSWGDSLDTLVGNVGEHTFKAYFASNDKNYESYECDVLVNVRPKELIFTEVMSTFKYDGSAPQITYKIFDGSNEYTGLVVTGNNKNYTEAGTYPITLAISDENYIGSITVDLVINPKVINIPKEDTTQFVYNGLDQTYFVAESEYYTVIGNVHSAAGDYEVTISLKSINYIWEDNTTNNKVYSFMIEKATYDMSNAKWDYESPFTYSGANNTVRVTGLPEGVSVSSYTSNTFKNAGIYTASVILKYDNKNYYDPVVEDLNWQIVQKEVEVTWNFKDSYAYTGETLAIPTAFIVDVNNLTQYISVFCENEFINAGTYTFIATLPEALETNYILSLTTQKELTVTIGKANNVISNLTIENWIYNTNISTPTATAIDGTIIFLYSSEEKGTFSETVPTTVGTYYVKAYVPETENYNAAEAVKSFEITKATYDMSSVKWNYTEPFIYSGDTYSVLVEGYPQGLVPNYTGNDEVDANTYTTSVKFEYDSINYFEPIFESLTWEIKRKTVEISWSQEDSYIYTGEELNKPTASITLIDGTVTQLVISYDKQEFIAAGEYVFTASLPTELCDNYELADSTNNKLKIEINKADPTIEWPTAEVVWGTSLGNITLGGGFDWGEGVNVNDVLQTVGDEAYTCAVVYTPSDTNNFNKLYGYITITVIRKETTIESNSQTEHIFDPENTLGFEFIPTSNNTDSSVEYEIVYYYRKPGASLDIEPEIVGSIVNAGSYEVVVTTKQTDLYEAATETFNVNVAQAEASMTTEEKANITAEYGDTFDDTVLPTSVYEAWNDHGTWAITDSISTYSLRTNFKTYDSVVEKAMYAIFTPNSSEVNYKETIIEVVVKVNKRQLSFEITSDESFVYSGTVPKITYVLKDKNDSTFTDIIVSDDNTNINVGIYEVTLTIVSDLYIGNVTTSIEITQATNSLTDLNILDWIYGNSANKPNVNTVFGDVSDVLYTYSTSEHGEYATTVPIDAGTYYVKASLDGTTNYTEAISEPFEFNITQKAVDVIWDNSNYTYTGTELTKPTATIRLVDGTNYTLETSTPNKFINAGTYQFTATIADASVANNYVLSNNTTKEYVVNKKVIDRPLDISKAYNETVQYSGLVDTTYYTVAEEEGLTDKGSYDVILTLRDFENYKWNDSELATTKVKFSITATENSWITKPSIANNVLTYGETLILSLGEAQFGDYKDIKVMYKPVGASDEQYTTTAPTNIGNYQAYIYIEGTDDYGILYEFINYQIVAKAIDAPTTDATYTYTGLEQEFELVGFDSEIMSIEGTTKATNASINNVVVTLNSNNYVWANGQTEIKFVFEIKALEVEVSWSVYEYVFTGSKLEYPTASITAVNNEEVILTITPNKEFINVGTYEFSATTTNRNYTLINNTKTVEIEKVDNEITELVISNWTYGGTPSTPNVTSKFTNSTLKFLYSDSLSGVYTETVPSNAGTYYVKAYIGGTDNYNEITSSAVEFIILQKAVSLPTVKGTYTYTGEALTVVLNGFDSTYMTIKENTNVVTDAGKHYVSISLDSNYKWSDSTDGKVEWNVSKANAIIAVDTTPIEKVYGTSFDIPTATSNFGKVDVTYEDMTNVGEYVIYYTVSDSDNFNGITKTVNVKITPYVVTLLKGTDRFEYTGSNITYVASSSDLYSISDNVALNVGIYNATISLNDKTNYVWATTLTSEDITHTFEIYALKVVKPTADTKTYVYNTQEHTYGISSNEFYTVSNNKRTLAGSQTVTVSLVSNNYVWENGSSEDLEFTFTILKGTYDMAKVAISNSSLEYNGQVQTVELINLPEGVTVAQYSGNTGTNFGTYSLNATFNYDADNYNEPTIGKITWNIIKKEVNVVWSETEYEYTGSQLSKPIASITLTNGTLFALDVNDFEFVNVGTYTFIASTTNENILMNYELKYTSKEYTVLQKDPNIDFSSIVLNDVYYGTILQNISLPSGFSWKIKETQLTTIGTNSYEAIYTPENNNYKTVTGSISITVLRLNAALELADSYSYDYNATAIDLTNIVVDGLNHEEIVSISFKYYVLNKNNEVVRETTEIMNVGKYKVEVLVSESAIYSSITGTTYVTIEKGDLSGITAPTNISYPYNTELTNAMLPTHELGTWTLVNGNELLDAIPTDVVKLLFTPFDENYNTITFETVYITVTKLEASITNNAPKTLNYSGDAINYMNWFVASHKESTIVVIVTNSKGVTVTEIIDADTYTLTYYLPESAHYSAVAQKSTTIVVNKVNYTPSAVPTGITAIYGQKLNDLSFATYADGVWTWVNGTASVGSIGNNTFKAIFTPNNKNYNTSEHNIVVTVSKSTHNEILTFTASGCVYGGTITANATALHGTPTFLYSTTEDGEYTSTVPTNAGTYYVKAYVSETDDYAEALSENAIQIVISRADISSQITWPSYSGTYEGEVTRSAYSSNGILGEFNVPAASDITFGYGSSLTPMNGGYASVSEGITGSITMTFKPENTSNYVSDENGLITYTQDITLHPVCYVGSIYYGTIEDALDYNTTGTVFVIPGTNPTIRRDAEVKGDVKLFVAYKNGQEMKLDAGNAELFKGDNSSPLDRTGNTEHSGAINGTYDDFATTIDAFLKNTVTVASGIKLTISSNAIVEVAGQLSAGGGGCNAAGQTAGWYSRIALEDNSQIINNGTIYLYGYIDEASKNNDSIVINNKDIYMPFIMRDFRGGSIMACIYYSIDDYKMSAFNQMEFRNITALTRTNNSGNIYTWANIYAGEKYNHTKVIMIGASEEAVVQLTESYSYIICKYDTTTEIHKLNVCGAAETNSMTLTIDDITADTASVYFPLSWRFDITLEKSETQPDNKNALFTMSQMFKMMPGAKLTVAQGAELNINELNVYTEFIDKIWYENEIKGTSGSVPYYQDRSDFAKIPAKLIVNGSLTAQKLAGYVYTETSGAVLDVKIDSKLKTHEPEIAKMTLWFQPYIMEKTTEINENLKLQMYEKGIISEEHTVKGTGKYYSVNNGWVRSSATITFDSNGGTTCSQLPIKDIGNLGYTMKVTDLPTTTRAHYTFVGWYFINNEGVKEFVNKDNLPTIYEDITLYAEWTPDKYSIDYVEKYVDGDVVIDINSNNKNNLNDEFTVETTKEFTKDGTNLSLTGYQFGGYYLDSALTKTVGSINGETIVNSEYFANGKITIYIKWIPAEKIQYKVNFSNSNTTYTCDQVLSYDTIEEIDFNDFATFATANSNDQHSQYFAGWKYNNTYISASNIQSLFSEEVTEITLTADWQVKKHITINVTLSSMGTVSKYADPISFYYISGATLTGYKSKYVNTTTNYAYTAKLTNGSTVNNDYTLTDNIATTDFGSEVTLDISLYETYLINFSIKNHSEISSGKLTVTNYMDAITGKLITDSNFTYSTKGGSTTVRAIYNADISVYAKCAKYNAIHIYDGDRNVLKEPSLYGSATYTTKLTRNATYSVED